MAGRAQGLQGFHGSAILKPCRRDERSEPERLEIRFEAFRRAAGHGPGPAAEQRPALGS